MRFSAKFIHYLFSNIRYAEDASSALLNVQAQGLIAGEGHLRELKHFVRDRLEKSEAREWFTRQWRVYNECSILVRDKDGNLKTHRPDRVITDGETTLVIDYKCGNKKEDHKRQVNEYCDFLRSMGHKNVKGFLWYLYPDQLVFHHYLTGEFRHFLNEYIASCCACSEASPIWIPQYQTINELFASMSPLTVADKIETICRIHKIYLEETGSSETLDFFYGWGERLLADFDDIDKNMADADKLFRNIRDIKKIDEIGSLLGDGQEQALSKFFSDFSVDANSKLKGKYLELWNALGAIYHKLNQQMKESCLAYEGAQFRSVVEMLQEKGLPEPLAAKQYAFVGFNVLDKVESALFSLRGINGNGIFLII